MAYCKDCKTMVKVDADTDIEVDDLTLTEDGEVYGSVTIKDLCQLCHNTVRFAVFDISLHFDERPAHDCPDKDIGMGWTVEVLNIRRTERHHPPNHQRYRTYYGVDLDLRVKCPCGLVSEIQNFKNEVQASNMGD